MCVLLGAFQEFLVNTSIQHQGNKYFTTNITVVYSRLCLLGPNLCEFCEIAQVADFS